MNDRFRKADDFCSTFSLSFLHYPNPFPSIPSIPQLNPEDTIIQIIQIKFHQHPSIDLILEFVRLAHVMSKGYAGPVPYEKWIVDIGIRSGFIRSRPVPPEDLNFVLAVSLWAFIKFLGRGNIIRELQISQPVYEILQTNFKL